MTDTPLVDKETELIHHVAELESALGGIEASRRVGWAKYYDTNDELIMTRARFAFGIGVALRVGERIKRSHIANDERRRSVAANLTDWIIEATFGDWPGDFTAITMGIDFADEYVEEKFGDWGRAVEASQKDVVLYLELHPKEAAWRRRQENRRNGRTAIPAGDVRCETCNHLLAKRRADGSLDMLCRCGTHALVYPGEET